MQRLSPYQINRRKFVHEYILEKLSLDTARVLSWLLTKAALLCPHFSETCKVLGIQRIHTSSYPSESNGVVERWHRTLHTGLSHLVNHSHTDWNLQVQFFLMVYRATPHTTTGYSPFYLLHGREMSLPGNENLKAKFSTNPREIDQLVENLKASLGSAFRSVKWANKKSHLRNKSYHDRRAKHREFGVGDLVYLYQPARRPGLSAKFFYPWTGPHQITAKLSTINYEIHDCKAKKQVVHINRLKAAHVPARWKPVNNRNRARKPNSKRLEDRVSEVEVEFRSRPIPLAPEAPTGFRRTVAPTPVVPQPAPPILDTPGSERTDPSYFPPTTPSSRRDVHPTRFKPPVRRARARLLPPDARHSPEHL